MSKAKRLALATAYWLIVVAVFILSTYRSIEGIWVVIVTLPWSLFGVLVGIALFVIGNGHEWSSHTAVEIVDCFVFVVLCGGLNAVLIAGVLKIGKGLSIRLWRRSEQVRSEMK
jgi:hypothetical protein